MFYLCHVFQEHTPGIKRDLSVEGANSKYNPQGEYKIIQPTMSSHFSERKIVYTEVDASSNNGTFQCGVVQT